MMNDKNVRLTPDGRVEERFRREVRDILDLNIFTHNDAILAELRRLKKIEQETKESLSRKGWP